MIEKDMKEKLVDIVEAYADFLDWDTKTDMVDSIMELIAHDNNVGRKWISVKDRLPEMRDDGFADAFLVTDGSLAHIAYFVDGEWIFTDNGQMKEPMFYDVTHWLCLPQPPKGE